MACHIPGFGHDGQLALHQAHFILHAFHILLRSVALLHQVLVAGFLPVQVLLQPCCLWPKQSMTVLHLSASVTACSIDAVVYMTAVTAMSKRESALLKSRHR